MFSFSLLKGKQVPFFSICASCLLHCPIYIRVKAYAGCLSGCTIYCEGDVRPTEPPVQAVITSPPTGAPVSLPVDFTRPPSAGGSSGTPQTNPAIECPTEFDAYETCLDDALGQDRSFCDECIADYVPSPGSPVERCSQLEPVSCRGILSCGTCNPCGKEFIAFVECTSQCSAFSCDGELGGGGIPSDGSLPQAPAAAPVDGEDTESSAREECGGRETELGNCADRELDAGAAEACKKCVVSCTKVDFLKSINFNLVCF